MTFGSRLRPCEPAMHPACWQGYLAEDFEQTMRRPHCVPCRAVLYVRAVWCVNRRRPGRQGARASGGNRPRLLRVATAEVRQAALCSPSCRACQRASSANPFESIEPTSARRGASASSARRLRLAWQAAKTACMQPYAKMGCHTVLGAACSPRPHLAPPASPRRRLLYCTTCSYARPHSVTVRRMYDMRVVVAAALRFLTIACAFEATAVSAIRC